MSSTTTKWILELVDRISAPTRQVGNAVHEVTEEVEALQEAVNRPLQEVQRQATEAAGAANELGENLNRTRAIDIYAIGEGFRTISDGIQSVIEPGAEFEAQLAEVNAITGVAGEKLEELGSSARQAALDFGGDAAAQLEAYKTVLSRLGPDLAKSPQAIDNMGKSIQTLSKTMNGDAVGATDALTTAMLQYQVNLDDPIEASKTMAEMMNVMAAGAKYGAAEVPQISSALEQSGVQAKLANLSFSELNSAIQAMAEGGKYGSEAGIAIRNVLTNMSAPDALSKDATKILSAYRINMKAVSDTSIPFAERLKLLAPIQNDLNALTAVFGRENSANAQILIRSAGEQAKMTKEITGTNTATEQAAIIMDSYKEKMSRMGAWFNDIKISLFGVASSVAPAIEGLSNTAVLLANARNAYDGMVMMVTGIKSLVTGVKILEFWNKVTAASQWLLNAAFVASPIGWIVAGLAAVTAGILYAWKHFEGFRKVVLGLWEVFKQVFSNILGLFKAVFAPIGEAFQAIKEGRYMDAAKAVAALNPISTAARVVQYVSQGGLTKGVSAAWEKGKEEGAKSWKADQDKKKEGLTVENATSGKKETEQSPVNKVLSGTTAKGKEGMQISGSGTGKAITMNLEIKNYFSVADGTDVRSIADKVAGVVVDRLKDSLVTS